MEIVSRPPRTIMTRSKFRFAGNCSGGMSRPVLHRWIDTWPVLYECVSFSTRGSTRWLARIFPQGNRRRTGTSSRDIRYFVVYDFKWYEYRRTTWDNVFQRWTWIFLFLSVSRVTATNWLKQRQLTCSYSHLLLNLFIIIIIEFVHYCNNKL